MPQLTIRAKLILLGCAAALGCILMVALQFRSDDALIKAQEEVLKSDDPSAKIEAILTQLKMGGESLSGMQMVRMLEDAQQAAKAERKGIEDMDDKMADGKTMQALEELLIGLLAVLPLTIFLIITITRQLRAIQETSKRVSEGDFAVKVPYVGRRDEVGAIADSLNILKGVMEDSFRVRSALDGVSSNVMMADADLNIIYVNHSVVNMLKTAEADIRKDLPRFDAATLVGTNIDSFHKNPSHQRGMLKTLDRAYNTTITVGGRIFDLIATPVFGSKKERLGTVVEWQDVTVKRMEEARATRIQTSLDCVTSNVMLADEKNIIIYMNPAVLNMMRVAEADIRKDLPNFDTAKLIGSSVDVFHKKPEHQKSMLASLRSTYRTSIVVGGRTFALVANPVFGKKEERLGTVVEWRDITLELQVENEVNNIVEAAVKGDFTQNLKLEGKEGFMLNLSKGINQICQISDKGLAEVERVLSLLSEGNLTEQMDGEYHGAFAQIQGGLNNTITRLKGMVMQIKQSATSVNEASSEISTGSADLSQRTEEQASSLEETAASMEQITGTVKQNSENAKNANGLASTARDIAQRGGNVVSETVSAMQSIEKSSQKIADIIGVIDEIAFQTNLLALNAAVEAARAGDAGKGFAVVASEVRSLAGRSASASKEIKALILESGQQVKTGSELVSEAGKTLQEIVNSVKQVADIIAEITTASVEQSTGIEEVNSAIAQMDEVTQQNAALVEENTAASQSLVKQAENLEALMRFFTVDEDGGDGELDDMPRMVTQSAKPKALSKPTAKPAATAVKKPNGPASKPKTVAGTKVPEYHEGWEEF